MAYYIDFTHGHQGSCLSFIKIIASITLPLPRLQVFAHPTPSAPSRGDFTRAEGTATEGVSGAAGPGIGHWPVPCGLGANAVK